MKKDTISVLEKLVGVIDKQAKEITTLRRYLRTARADRDGLHHSGKVLTRQLEDKQRIIDEKDALINSLCIGNRPTPPTMPFPTLPEGTVFLDDTGRPSLTVGYERAGA